MRRRTRLPIALAAVLSALLLLASVAGLHLRLSGPAPPGAALSRALELEAAGERAAAILRLKSWLQEAPGDGEARLALGRMYLAVEDAAGAAKELDLAHALQVRAAGLVPMLARALLLQGEPRRVLALELADGSPPGERADLAAAKALALLELDRPGEGRHLVEVAAALAPPSAWVRYAHARVLAADGAHEDAVAVLGALVRDHPREGVAWSLLGRIHAHRGELERAEAAFGQAIAHRGKPDADRLHRGTVRIRRGELALAQEDADLLMQRASTGIEAAYFAGKVNFLRKRYAEAGRILRRAYHADVYRFDVLFLLARTHLALGEAREAEPLAERAYELKPEWPFVRKVLAETYLRLDKGAAAEAVLRPYVAAHPGDLPATKALVNSVAQQGRIDEAAALTRAALRDHPHDAEILDALARLRRSGGGEPRRAPSSSGGDAQTANE